MLTNLRFHFELVNKKDLLPKNWNFRVTRDSNNNDIINCTTYNNLDGIDFLTVSNNSVINCTSYNNKKKFGFKGNGIYIRGTSPNNNFINCSVYDNENYGIENWGHPGNKFTNCVSYNNNRGICVYGFSNTYTKCSFYNNLEYGIYFWYAGWYADGNNNITYYNSYNNQYGIYILSQEPST